MKQLSALLLALVAGTGCYATGTSSGYYTTGGYATASVEYSAPPAPVVEADLYYEDRPGYVFINGRHTMINGQWVWQGGRWEVERANHVYVQGYWNGNVWVDGSWTAHRPGYVYTGGYWDRRHNNHVWVNGNWERDRGDSVYVRGRWSNDNGVRRYNRGTWSPRDHRDNRARRGPVVRDHR